MVALCHLIPHSVSLALQQDSHFGSVMIRSKTRLPFLEYSIRLIEFLHRFHVIQLYFWGSSASSTTLHRSKQSRGGQLTS